VDRLDSRACYDKAVELLARRSHFERQLEEKLLARKFSSREVEVCLQRLVGEQLLDDHRTAREFVETRLRRGPIGRRRMRFELAKRGAPEGVVEEALASLPESDLEPTRRVAAAWLRRGRTDWTALARHLDRKGFSTSSILTVVEESRREQTGEEGD